MKNKLTTKAAATLAGCTESYVRRLLRNGSLKGYRVSERCWLVEKSAAVKLCEQLSSRASKNQS